MVKIRLRRTGAKKAPDYRVVVAPSTAPRDGRFIEIVGHYHPRDDPPTLVLKEDRVFHWLSVGAQPSDSFERIMKSKGILEKYAQFKQGQGAETSAVEEAKTKAPEAVAPKAEAKKAAPKVATKKTAVKKPAAKKTDKK